MTAEYKSTFYWKEHPGHSDDHVMSLEADYVVFEPGFVVFYQNPQHHGPMRLTRIIRAVHSDDCHDLREVLNDVT